MSNLYKVSGALPLDAPSYIRRQADYDLYEGLLAGEFCYVLNSRQMGKSSLRVQTMRRLQEAGVACAAIDITKVGSQGITPEEWYAGVLFTLINQLHLSLTLQQFEDWWEAHRLLSPVNRFSEFIDGVLLEEIAGRIVIFVDEIDSILQLNFKDDFFAAIRACYNKRAENPEYDRLTFALLGVATPSNLIQDKNRTPFNIGRAIQLNGFQFEEARSLAQGLASKAVNSETVLQEILNWTGGQPFLTQKLCQLILASIGSIPEGREAIWMDQLVRNHIIENWESQDEPEHLRTIRNRILSNEQRASWLLAMYQQVLQQGNVRANNSEHMELRLSGLVVEHAGKLNTYNRIYRLVFNQDWLDRTFAELRPYSEALDFWFVSGCKDESRLLRGEALQQAKNWAEGKNLNNQDYQFLTASQELETQAIQRELDIEKQGKEVLSKANLKAKKSVRIGKILSALILSAAIVITVASLIFSRWNIQTANQQVENTQLQVAQAKKEAEKLKAEVEEAENKRQQVEKQINKINGKLRIGDLLLEHSSRAARQDLSQEEKAFLDTLAWSLGTLSSNGYQQLLSGDKFEKFTAHPRVQSCGKFYNPDKKICVDSAGRYHIDSETWDTWAPNLQVGDFSPESQDTVAIELLRDRGSLNELKSGRFESAIHKASFYWAPLPDDEGHSRFGAKPYSIKDLKLVYDYFSFKYQINQQSK